MEQNITRMMTLLARRSQSYISSALDKYNLTAAEQPFFMAMHRHAGATQDELTALVGVDKAATARAVQTLEAKGYLIKLQDGQNRRKNRIYPSDAARQLYEAVHAELLRFNARLTRGLDAQTVEQIYAALCIMEQNLAALTAETGGAADDAGK